MNLFPWFSYLSNLSPGTTYYVTAYAVNSVGIAFGPTLSFTTSFEQGGTGIRKADFPGGPRYSAASFSIGTKIYLGLGWDDGDNPRIDFWEWDQATNVWTRKANFGGPARNGAVGVSIGDKGYIGTGMNGNGQPYAFMDLWEYDPNLK